MSICLLDTSIFVEILNVPNMGKQYRTILAELKQFKTVNPCFCQWQLFLKQAIISRKMAMAHSAASVQKIL